MLFKFSERLTLIVTSIPNEHELNKTADAKVLNALFDFMTLNENQEASDELIVRKKKLFSKFS